jgi:hypothetical protein
MTLTMEGAFDRERELFRKMQDVGPSRRALRNAQDAYLRSSVVRLVAAERAGKKLGLTAQEVKLISQTLNPFARCNETVEIREIAKPEGGHRKVNDFGPYRRALDHMQARLLQARFTPHPHVYSVSGRGRDRACEQVAMDLQQIGGQCFAVTMDVADAYGSVDLGKVARLFPVPTAPLRNALSIPSMPLTTINLGSSDTVGLPQGSTASNLIMTMILRPLLEDLSNTVRSYLYVDDFLGFCDSEGAAVELKHALAAVLTKMPGHLKPRFLSSAPIAEGFDYLGYNFRRNPDDTLAIEISQKSVTRMMDKSTFRARNGWSLDSLTQYGDDWPHSFPLAVLDEGEKEYFASLPPEAFWMAKKEGFHGLMGKPIPSL